MFSARHGYPKSYVTWERYGASFDVCAREKSVGNGLPMRVKLVCRNEVAGG